ncbi:MAG: preprotein translocase subunit SecY [Chloroflexi bacterium]|nr:preprotein translocase subunit SecY [Chloroflexota bacterium]
MNETLERLLNAWRLPDLRRKLLYTFGILIIFRLIAHVPIPGVNTQALAQLFQTNQTISMLDLFSGGALTSFSVAAIGVYPYITATIVMQLLTPLIPRLEQLSKEGEQGYNRINQITRMITVPIAVLQAFGTVTLLHNAQGAAAGAQVIPQFGLWGVTLPVFWQSLAMLVTMTGGTVVLMWLGELITENGIGNGVSLIIFAGIVSRLPTLVQQTAVAGNNLTGALVLALVALVLVVGIVVIYQGERQIRVEYARRIRGNRQYQGGSTHIPLRVNSAGMIPLIFAMSIMLFPATVASYFTASPVSWIAAAATFIYNLFNSQGVLYWVLYFVLVVGFTYFYTLVVFQQQNLPEVLQKNGGFIPGIRPGRNTAEYLLRVLNRVTLAGALFLGLVAISPFFVRTITATQALTLSSTGLLIVVGVVLDTMKQLEAQLLMRRYQGFIR